MSVAYTIDGASRRWISRFGVAPIYTRFGCSLNVADVTMARAGRETPAITTARSALADAKAARDRECHDIYPATGFQPHARPP